MEKNSGQLKRTFWTRREFGIAGLTSFVVSGFVLRSVAKIASPDKAWRVNVLDGTAHSSANGVMLVSSGRGGSDS
jgi:hypothetical protein